MNHHFIASTNFSKRTLKALERKGIYIISSHYDTTSGNVLYTLNDNDTCRVRSYLEVLELAK